MIAILVYSSLFIVTFYNLGFWLNHRFDFKLDPWLFFPFGLIVWFGLIQFLIYPFVWLKVPTIIFFVVLGLLVLLINILGFVSKDKPRFSKVDLFYYFGMVLFVVAMVYFAAQRTLGQNSFDTNFYLSMVVQGAHSSTLSFVEYGTGFIKDVVNTQYDYQSFYAFGSFILGTFEPVVRLLNPDYFTISTHIYIWTTSILFYVLEYTLMLGMIKQLKLLRNPVTPFLTLLFLGYHSLVYYNNIFAFFGNTYRTWILSFLMLEIYRSLTTNSHKPLVLLLASSALIAVSSTGFFLGIIVLTPYVMILFYRKIDLKTLIRIVGLAILPTLLFSLFYLGTLQVSLFILISIAIIGIYTLLAFLYYYDFKFKDSIYSLIRIVILFGLPIFILGYSILSVIQGRNLPQAFFFDHRSYDMVWYYFNTETTVHIFINAIYYVSLFGYVFFSKSNYRWYVLALVVLFINPISAQFVSRFIASVVYYRSFEVIFNPFTVLIFATTLFTFIKWKRARLVLSILLFVGFLTKVVEHSQLYYHNSFLPSENYSSLYRVESPQIEALSVLKTKIAIENYKQARVVSQIEMVRGFVPNIVTPISNETIRSINRYAINKERSKLLTIFMNRDFIGQEIFDVEPEYENTCKYLMDERIDFVVVDKNQFYYDENGVIIPIYFKVRDCATPIYESDRYFIYQFYW